ncbi:efflux RND transporter periplasmic adaptor subunit [Psychroflexus sp. YR1-1]|uniref:Efflux RND transporter periplasmic adaptor subunit n=1 Tax=Psychroflexus aurantiacus TaxID=2709310 RepID=A0A6B3R1G3_9FLAO|nr:efflux RND transporter periplasmic adaptor subunit [Psychroflexus aurantiacus]NEV94433.1 efflux RND transporter periplasmic adaptor subunit [Psychroflexus aurantiacus]
MKTQYKYYLGFIVIFIIGIFLGITLFSPEPKKEDAHNHSQEQAGEAVWTCSMHPQIRQDEPGDCPICGMDLIPASKMEESIDPDAIKMSKTARKLAQVATTRLGTQNYESNLNLSGQLQVNADNTFSISTNFKARIERLFVNEEGEQVSKGEVVAEVYAPEIQVLKEELELARRQGNELLLNSILQKIQNYELSVDDVESLKNGRLNLRSPKTGIITNLKVTQGDNLKAGQSLMSIADLSSLWAILDVYENDLNKINVGDKLKLETPNYKKVSGEVTFITPVLDDETRSAKARVVINNRNLDLKPGVFITAEVIKTAPKSEGSETLMAPKSAVLWTGKRSVVYQQLENENGVYFKMKTVEIGETSSDFVEILSGLEPGDEVVTYGAFSIDSEAQLAGKPSMMNPEGGASMTGHQHGDMKESEETSSVKQSTPSGETINSSEEAKEELKPVLKDYLAFKNALATDDFKNAESAGIQLKKSIAEVDMSVFTDEAHDSWMQHSRELKKALEHIQQQNDNEKIRNTFQDVSEAMIPIVKLIKPIAEELYVQFCPMANSNNGAYWLSAKEEIMNPYYGESMLKCGEVTSVIK